MVRCKGDACDVKDKNLAPQGKERIYWAERNMPVLRSIQEQFEKRKPLKGFRIAACLHVTAETANLMRTLKAGGAHTVLCAANALSTQDDVAASLTYDFDIPVFAVHGEDHPVHCNHIEAALEFEPQITMDDGADLVHALHNNRREFLDKVLGGTEETAAGITRLQALAAQGILQYPIIAVHETLAKQLFDNRLGAAQSTLDGIMRATNFLFSGSVAVICGYGNRGRGIARRAKALGAFVTIVEVNPVRALEAALDGFRVMPLAEASKIGDLFITAANCENVIRPEHFKNMKDGAIVCNAGHYNVELDLAGLAKISSGKQSTRPCLEEYSIKSGRKEKSVFIIGQGTMASLAAAEGYPAALMDMSFAGQAMSLEYITKNQGKLAAIVHPIPEKIDKEIARLKLKALEITIDKLTQEQETYLGRFNAGT